MAVDASDRQLHECIVMMRSFVPVLLLAATPASADSHVAAGVLAGRPAAGSSGGLDGALTVRADHGLVESLEVGLGLELGHAPGNDDESLTRFAVLPSIAVGHTVGDLVMRGEFAAGWQIVDGRTHLAGNLVEGTEAHALRVELAASAQGMLSERLALRITAGLAVDGIYPASVDGGTRASPFVAFAIVARL
jgi:hypothetical protein